jgi:3-dehydroquinate synthase
MQYTFSEKTVQYYLDTPLVNLERLVPKDIGIIITDENLYRHHAAKFSGYKTIVFPAGEHHKNQSTIDYIIGRLIRMEAGRNAFIIGVGGGVVTDITGFAASIYMRGVKFGFVPTTVLAQVDAAIGGKNGIDSGPYKNLVGLVRQPDFILFDPTLLRTLPDEQWVNGFAEVIKHGCIKDETLFNLLEQHTLSDFRQDGRLLAALIERNVVIKSDVVKRDEFERNERKLLNFGHTVGHAIENTYQLLHGHAISIGMTVASGLSSEINNFPAAARERVVRLLQQYGLPTTLQTDKEKVFNILKMDKKRNSDEISFILLNRIGEAVIKPIPLNQLETLLSNLN